MSEINVSQSTNNIRVTKRSGTQVSVSSNSGPSISVEVAKKTPVQASYTTKTPISVKIDATKIATVNSWVSLVMNWSTEPTLNAEIIGGEVYDYINNGVTRYRFIPNPYNPLQDAFYSSFDGSTLSSLIVTRGSA